MSSGVRNIYLGVLCVDWLDFRKALKRRRAVGLRKEEFRQLFMRDHLDGADSSEGVGGLKDCRKG